MDIAFEKYNDIWNKSAMVCVKNEFDSKPRIKTRISSYSYKATNFHCKEMPKIGSFYNCLQ